jgi:hypothetical protein
MPGGADVHGFQATSDIHNLPGLATPGKDTQQPGTGLPASPGLGISGGAIGAAEGAASSAADMFAPGSGAAMQVGFQELNRAASYGAQVAGIGVEGLLEAILPNSSSVGGDWAKSIPGRLLMGVAGVRPSGQNTAGATTKPSSESEGSGQGPNIGNQFFGDNHFHGVTNPNDMHDWTQQQSREAWGAYPLAGNGVGGMR